MDDLANQRPQIGIRGPTHQPVTTPIIAAITTSGIKKPARKFLMIKQCFTEFMNTGNSKCFTALLKALENLVLLQAHNIHRKLNFPIMRKNEDLILIPAQKTDLNDIMTLDAKVTHTSCKDRKFKALTIWRWQSTHHTHLFNHKLYKKSTKIYRVCKAWKYR